MEQLFEALSATSLKADLAVEKEQMTISLKLPKDCKEAVWIQEIAAFTTALRQEKYKHSQGTDSFKGGLEDGTKEMQRMMQGAVVLTIASFIAKVLSAFYRVPFQNFVGDEGFYVYQQVYPIYGIAMTLALSGLPQFISKIVAEQPDIRSQNKCCANYIPMCYG